LRARLKKYRPNWALGRELSGITAVKTFLPKPFFSLT
jgi:hypothetical protein